MVKISELSNVELEEELSSLKVRRRKIIRDLNDNDTALIGVRLELEKRQEDARRKLESERDSERGELFDE